jgi:hypothetical protein
VGGREENEGYPMEIVADAGNTYGEISNHSNLSEAEAYQRKLNQRIRFYKDDPFSWDGHRPWSH